MNIASWRSYQDAHYPTWRLMGAGLAIGSLLLTPFNFWFTLSLLRAGDLPELQIRILQGAHAYSALFASAFLLFAWITRGQSTPTRFGYAMLSVGSASLILVAATISAANQLSHGGIVIFAFGCLIATVVMYERPRRFIAWIASGATMVLIASFFLQTDPGIAASVQLNTLVVAIAVSIVYPLYDRFRFNDHQRQLQLQRLIEMRNTLFRAMGHDLRTPLIEVRRVARLLDDPSSDLETHRSTLANDLDALTHRFGLVLNNLMALDTQLTEGATAQGPSALTEVIENVLELHQRDAERKGIDLHHELDDEVLVAVHRETLIAVLDNLLSNAVKFSPQGSAVTISAQLTPTSVVVAVRDPGPGIAPEALRRFERGEPLPPASGTAGERGVGIGLGVVRRLLKDVGSELTVTPAHPSGTLARFTLPRYRRSAPP